MKPTLSLVLVNTGTEIGLLKMQTEQEREARETPEIKEQREQKKGAAVLTPDETPSYPIGLILEEPSYLAIYWWLRFISTSSTPSIG
jgi:hypothetical protein